MTQVAEIVAPLSLVAWAAGASATTLSPKDTVTISEIRLKNVFVDIDFLSLVVKKTFSFTAGKDGVFTS
jgi:hypothetical protein